MDLFVIHPCYQSDVEIRNFKGRWNAIQICQYYIDNSWPIPSHFTEWAKFCKEKCKSLRQKYSRYYVGIQEKYYHYARDGNVPEHILDDSSIEVDYLE